MSKGKNKLIYLDLDDTLADFYSASKNLHGTVDEYKMWHDEFFLNLRPIPGARGAVFDLQKLGYDIWVLTQPLAECFESYSDKAKWVQLHFPSLYKKIIMTQDKGLHLGDYLVDDNKEKWKEKFEKNGGKFVHYPYNVETRVKMNDRDHHDAWDSIIRFFKSEYENLED